MKQYRSQEAYAPMKNNKGDKDFERGKQRKPLVSIMNEGKKALRKRERENVEQIAQYNNIKIM